MAQTIEVDGETLLVAGLVRRGAALAVDLCVAVLSGSILFWLLSTQVPLDTEAARGPVLVVILAAGVYLVWARDHVLPSPGRRIFELRILRPGSGVAALGRPITVHRAVAPKEEYNRAALAALVVGAASLGGMYLLAFGLKTTTVYRSVLAYTERTEPFAVAKGAPPRLGVVPRALLVGKRRAYLQSPASWGEQPGNLEYFLHREPEGWRVVEVRVTEPSMYGRFALAVSDEEVPKPSGPREERPPAP